MENKEASDAIHERYKTTHPERVRSIRNTHEAKCIEQLSDSYIKKRLRQRLNIRTDDFPPDELQGLVDLQRATLMLKRVLREHGIYLR